MKYAIYDKTTGLRQEGWDAIVTQGGEVAFWDEGQGWRVESDQSKYTIELLEP